MNSRALQAWKEMHDRSSEDEIRTLRIQNQALTKEKEDLMELLKKGMTGKNSLASGTVGTSGAMYPPGTSVLSRKVQMRELMQQEEQRLLKEYADREVEKALSEKVLATNVSN